MVIEKEVYNLIFKYHKWANLESISKEIEEIFKLTTISEHLKATCNIELRKCLSEIAVWMKMKNVWVKSTRKHKKSESVSNKSDNRHSLVAI